MEIKLWILSACIKGICYCFEDFTKPLTFFVSKNIITKESQWIKISNKILVLYAMRIETHPRKHIIILKY